MSDVPLWNVTVVQPPQHLDGVRPELHLQVIDQMQPPVLVDLSEQCHFRIGGASAGQGAPRVVAQAAYDGGAQTARAENRMRFAPEWLEQALEAMQRGAGMTDYLCALLNQ